MEELSDEFKVALVAGAVTGNEAHGDSQCPNLAGVAILRMAGC